MSKTSSSVKASAALPSARLNQNILTAAKGGGIVFAGMLFQYGGRFIIGILQARFLGAEQFGLCNLALSAATIAAGLALLGLPSAMVRYVSLFVSRRDTARLWGTLQTGLGMIAIVSAMTGIGLFVLADPIAEQLFDEPRLAPLLRVISLAVPFLALNNVTAAVTRGFKKMQYSVIGQNISQPAIRLTLIMALAITVGLNVKRALAAFGVTVAIVFVMLLYFLNKLFSLKRSPRTARHDTKKVLRFALPIYLTSLIRLFGGNIQTMLLGALNAVTSVGIFAAASQINMVGQMFHRGISTASAPIVSELYGQGEREQMGRFYQTVTKWTFTLNLPLFLIVLLFPVPILSIFGQGFVEGAMALNVLAWANLVNTGTGICGTVLDMTGNTSLKLVNSVVTFVLTLGLNILLIPVWGLVGAAVASLTAVTLVNLLRLLEVFILFRMLPYNASFIKPITAGLVTLAVSWGVRLLSPPQVNLVYTAMNVAILLAVYVGMMLLLGLSQEDRMVLARLRGRMGRMFSRS
jgi:O-antigen/teichoic acid export membrane protein